MKELPEQRQKQQVLETFKRIFQAFSFYSLWDSYWPLSTIQGTHLVILSTMKMHVSKAAPYHPNNQ